MPSLTFKDAFKRLACARKGMQPAKPESVRYLDDLSLFSKELFRFPDIDYSNFHGKLMRFLEWSRTTDHGSWSRVYPTHRDLGLHAGAVETGEAGFPVDLDGGFRGMFSTYRGNGRKKLVLLPRGHLKSTIITCVYVLWRLARDPNIRILIANATAGNSYKFVRALRWQVRHNAKLREAFPHVFAFDHKAHRARGFAWTGRSFDVNRTQQFEQGECSVEGVGVGGHLTSRHYDLIIFDDLVSDKNVTTPDMIDKTIEWWAQAHSLLDPIRGEEIVVGTRWHYADLYAKFLDENDEIHRDFAVCLATLRGEDGSYLFPQKFGSKKKSEEKLRAEHSDYLFSCLYNNQPVDPKAAKFRREWWKFYGKELPDGVYTSFMTLDPAISAGEKSDNSAFVVVSVNPDEMWYIRHVEVMKTEDPGVLIDKLFELAHRFKVTTIGVESFAFQKYLTHGFEREQRARRKFYVLKKLTPDTRISKEARISRIIPKLQRGEIALPGSGLSTQLDGFRMLLEESYRFPKWKRNDCLDALAYVFDVAFRPAQPTFEEHPDMSLKAKILRRIKRLREGRKLDAVLGRER